MLLDLFVSYLSLGRWYSEKFVKGQWRKEECVAEWQKYRACLSVCLITSCSFFYLNLLADEFHSFLWKIIAERTSSFCTRVLLPVNLIKECAFG